MPLTSSIPGQMSSSGREPFLDLGQGDAAMMPLKGRACFLLRVLPWFLDGLALAYLMTGNYAFDSRIALTSQISVNQVLGLLVMAELLWFGWRGRFEYVRGSVTLTMVLLLTALLLVRAWGSTNGEYAQFKVFSHVFLILPVLLHVEIHARGQSAFRRLIQVWLLGSMALLVLSLPHMVRIQDGERLAVLAGGPNVLARLVGTGILCGLVMFRVVPEAGRRRWMYVAWLPLALWALLLTGTKAVFLAIPIALVVLVWRPGSFRPIRRALFALFLLGSIPLLAHRMVQDRPKDGGIVRLLRLPDLNDPQGSYGARLRYVHGTWRQLQHAPWLGVGTGEWGIRMGFGPSPTYPHNIFLELLAELGCMGLLVVMVPLVRFPFPAARGKRKFSRMQLGLMSLSIFWLLNVQLSGDLVDSRYFWLFLLLLELHVREGQSADPEFFQMAGSDLMPSRQIAASQTS